MLITAWFIIAGKWDHAKCPSTNELIRKLWYIYTMEYYSAIKNECKGNRRNYTEGGNSDPERHRRRMNRLT